VIVISTLNENGNNSIPMTLVASQTNIGIIQDKLKMEFNNEKTRSNVYYMVLIKRHCMFFPHVYNYKTNISVKKDIYL
jgi:hypothetical protein